MANSYKDIANEVLKFMVRDSQKFVQNFSPLWLTEAENLGIKGVYRRFTWGCRPETTKLKIN